MNRKMTTRKKAVLAGAGLAVALGALFLAALSARAVTSHTLRLPLQLLQEVANRDAAEIEYTPYVLYEPAPERSVYEGDALVEQFVEGEAIEHRYTLEKVLAEAFEGLDFPFSSVAMQRRALEALEGKRLVGVYGAEDTGCEACTVLVALEPDSCELVILGVNTGTEEHSLQLLIEKENGEPRAVYDIQMMNLQARRETGLSDEELEALRAGASVEQLATTEVRPPAPPIEEEHEPEAPREDGGVEQDPEEPVPPEQPGEEPTPIEDGEEPDVEPDEEPGEEPTEPAEPNAPEEPKQEPDTQEPEEPAGPTEPGAEEEPAESNEQEEIQMQAEPETEDEPAEKTPEEQPQTAGYQASGLFARPMLLAVGTTEILPPQGETTGLETEAEPQSEPEPEQEAAPEPQPEPEITHEAIVVETEETAPQAEDNEAASFAVPQNGLTIASATVSLLAYDGNGSYSNPYRVNNAGDFLNVFQTRVATAPTDAVVWIELYSYDSNPASTLYQNIQLRDEEANISERGIVIPDSISVYLVTKEAQYTLYTAEAKRHFNMVGDCLLRNYGSDVYPGEIILSGRTTPGNKDDANYADGSFKGGGIAMHPVNSTTRVETAPYLADFTFTECSDASWSGSIWNDGGVVYVLAKNFSDIALGSSGQYQNCTNIINCHFIDNQVQGTITISPVEPNNIAGGMIFVRSLSITGGQGNLVARGCSFTNNTAQNDSDAAKNVYSAGIYGQKNSNATSTMPVDILIENCSFTGNSADRAGAVYAFGTVTAKSCQFTNNTARRSFGGAICIQNGGSTDREKSYFEDCIFRDNEGVIGGAVSFVNLPGVENQAELQAYNEFFCSFTNCEFYDNTAHKRGGAISTVTCTTQLTGCVFDGNSVTHNSNLSGNPQGGAVVIQRFGNANLGLYSFVDNCTFRNNSLTNNDASVTGQGGALFLGNANLYNNAGTQVNSIAITNTVFEDNHTYGKANGGAIYVNGATGNAAVRSIVLTRSGEETTTRTVFKDNTSEGEGGAIYLNYGALDVQRVPIPITQNTAGKGGAIAANAPTGTNGVHDCFIRTSYAGKITVEENSAVHGAGIYVAPGTRLTLENSVTATALFGSIGIKNNGVLGEPGDHATDCTAGGGIYADTNATLEFAARGETQIEKNYAVNGGGIYLGAGAKAQINSNTDSPVTGRNHLLLDGNMALVKEGAGGNGGGVYMESTASFTTSGAYRLYVSNNTAQRDGGGFYVARDSDADGANDARNTLRLGGASGFDGNVAWKVFDYELAPAGAARNTAMLTPYLQRVMRQDYYNPLFGEVFERSEAPFRPGEPCFSLYNNKDVSIYVPDIDIDLLKAWEDAAAESAVDWKEITLNLFADDNGTEVRVLEVVLTKNDAGNIARRETLYPDMPEQDRAKLPPDQGLTYTTYRVEEDSGGYFRLASFDMVADTNANPRPTITRVNERSFRVEYSGSDANVQTQTAKVAATVLNDYNYNTAGDTVTVTKQIQDDGAFPQGEDFTVTLVPVALNNNVWVPLENTTLEPITLKLNGDTPSIPLPSAGQPALAYGVKYRIEEDMDAMPAGYGFVGISLEDTLLTLPVIIMKEPAEPSFTLTVVNKQMGMQLVMRKVDAVDVSMQLPGAGFALYKCEGGHEGAHGTPGDDTSCWEAYSEAPVLSNEYGLLDFGLLEPGDYALVEQTAPYKYALPNGHWTFAVNADTTMTTPQAVDMPPAIYQLEAPDADGVLYLVTNMTKLDVPKAGVLQNLWPIWVAAGVLFTVIPIYVFAKRQTKRKR